MTDYMIGCKCGGRSRIFQEGNTVFCTKCNTYMKPLIELDAPLSSLSSVGLDGLSPTEKQVNSACLSYRHDFGLMEHEQCENMRFQAKEWLRAWQKEFGLR